MLLGCRIQQARNYTFILNESNKYFQIRCPNTSNQKKKKKKKITKCLSIYEYIQFTNKRDYKLIRDFIYLFD